MSAPDSNPSPSRRIGRHPERGVQDRAELDSILDSCRVATLSTVKDGLPLVVPVLYARDGDRLLVHGSTGAGALREAAAGAPVALSVAILDALVYADSLFHSSANYRSAVVMGTMQTLRGEDAVSALDLISEVLLPGRPAEVRGHLPKEVAATLVLALPIADWTAKRRTGGPGGEQDPDVWTGVLPVTRGWGEPSGTGPESAAVAQLSRSERTG